MERHWVSFAAGQDKLNDAEGYRMNARRSPGASFPRRTFLKYVGALAASGAPAGLTLALHGCGGGSSSTQSFAPFPDLTVVTNPVGMAVSVQARQVQWVAGVNPAQPNAWAYVAAGATPASTVLPNHLGAIVNVRRNATCTITWSNTIPASQSSPLMLDSPPIDTPPVLAMCGNVQVQSPVGVVTHLHGARVAADFDGWPLAPLGFSGNPYGFPQSRAHPYPNVQRGTLLWYHDHAMDRTGRHVHAGLAGLYFIRDAADDAILSLVGGSSRELPLVIQDRILSADRTSIDYAAGMPADGPLARPEFLGTSLFVNGHPTPDLTLERRALRFRILNGSNARTYALALYDPDALAGQSGQVWQTQCMRLIGCDGGLISNSVPLGPTDVLVMAPAQRRDVIVDLSALPASVSRLRLVNLSLKYLLAADSQTPEAIYTTFEDSVLPPTDARYNSADATLYAALELPLATIMRMALNAEDGAPPPALAAAAIDSVLAAAANDDDFVWTGGRLDAPAGATFGANRLVLLMSNTLGLGLDDPVNGITGWSDVQIFEMLSGGSDWTLPFDVDLATSANPQPGQPVSVSKGYALARRSFFAQERAPDITVAKAYPPIHAPTISARAGTYERWYVANIGNVQPQSTASDPPDMHPFHIHLVNFVVTRRWQLTGDTTGSFVPLPASPLDLDLTARQDTVLIPSNQMLELLVHYPQGFSGDYAYHCHILEHGDMCMMSHFHVDPSG